MFGTILGRLTRSGFRPFFINGSLRIGILTRQDRIYHGRLTHINLGHAHRRNLGVPATGRMVTLRSFQTHMMRYLISVTLGTDRLTARIVRAQRIIFTTIRIFRGRVNYHRERLNLISPTLSVITVIVNLTPTFNGLITDNFTRPTRSLMLRLTLNVNQALRRLLRPYKALRLPCHALRLTRGAAATHMLSRSTRRAGSGKRTSHRSRSEGKYTNSHRCGTTRRRTTHPRNSKGRHVFRRFNGQRDQPLSQVTLTTIHHRVPLSASFFRHNTRTISISNGHIIIRRNIKIPRILRSNQTQSGLTHTARRRQGSARLIFNRLNANTNLRISSRKTDRVRLRSLISGYTTLTHHHNTA